MTRRLYYIGAGSASWRDPRNWALEEDGKPLRHLHLRGGEHFVVTGSGTVDLRDCPAAVEVTEFTGRIRLPGTRRYMAFPPKKRWWKRRESFVPRMPSFLIPNLSRAGEWRRAVAAGLATLALTPGFGWLLIPRISGGAAALVHNGTAVASAGTTAGAQAANPAFGAATTATNCLVATVTATISTASGTFSCSDSTWALAVSDTTRANCQTAIYFKPNCAAGETAPTFSYSNTATVTAALWEFSGVVGLEITAHGNGVWDGVSSDAFAVATCAAVDAATGNLIVTSNSASTTTSHNTTSSETYNNGATPTGNLNNDATTTRNHYRFAYGITTGHASADSNTYDNGLAFTGSTGSTCLASFRLVTTTLYWVGGTGTWDTPGHWATSTGGTAGTGLPAPGDTVNFDSNSGAAATVTVNATARAATVNVNKSDLSLTHGAANTTFCTGVITLTTGTWNTAGFALTIGGFAVSGSGSATLTMGASAIATTGTNAWSGAGTITLTITTNTAVVTSTGGGASLSLGTRNWQGASFSMTGSGALVVNGASWTVANFTCLTATSVLGATLSLGGSPTITGALTLGGHTVKSINRLLVQSNTFGTTRTLTVGSVVIAGDVDFSDYAAITFSGATQWWNDGTHGSANGAYVGVADSGTATVLANRTAPATQTATGTASFTWSTHGWTSRVPLPQDNVVISNVFVSGRTITADMPRLGKTIDASGATWAGTAPIFSISSIAVMNFGGFILASGMTLSGANTWTCAANGVSSSFNLAGAKLSGNLTFQFSNTWATLDLECSTARTVTFANGATQTVTTAITMTGAAGQNLTLHSADSVTTTRIAVTPGCAVTLTNVTKGTEVIFGFSVVATAGSAAITGTAATLPLGRQFTATAGAVAITGTAATLPRGLKIAALAGSVTISGAAANLARSITYTASSGDVTITGDAATLQRALSFGALAGTTDLSGAAATLPRGFNLSATAGTTTIDGFDASRLRIVHLTALPGDVTLTGDAGTLSVGFNLGVEPGSLAITGLPATSNAGHFFPAGPAGSFTVPRSGRITFASEGRLTKASHP